MKLFIILLILFTPLQFLFTQNSMVRFKKLTIDDGLSLSSIYCIHRDSKGNMWFGTEDGLNKYDGYHFKIYRTNASDENSICYKWIEHIHEDTRGHFWFGSRSGLSYFNPEKEIFRNYFKNNPPHYSLPNDTITCLTQYTDSLIFVGTRCGLNIINIYSQKSSSIKEINTSINCFCKYGKTLWVGTHEGIYQITKQENKGFSTAQITNKPTTSICISNNNLWYSEETKIGQYNFETQKTISFPIVLNHNKEEIIEQIIHAKKNKLYISTTQGLYLYSSSKNKLKSILKTSNQTNSLATIPNKPCIADKQGTLWYGSHGDGLYTIDSTGNKNLYIHNPVNKYSINQNSINCIYHDTLSNNIWIGTFGAGLNIYNPSANKFNLIKHNPLNKNSIASNFIWSILEDNEGNLWLGSNNKGISKYNPTLNKYVFFDHKENCTNCLSNSTVRELFQDSRGNIWVGTDGGGLNLYNPDTKSFKVYKKSPDPSSISNNSVRVIFEDSKGNYWVGTQNGLNKFNPKTNKFIRYLHNENDPNSISNNFIYSSIIEDRNGYLWIGTYGGGLNRYDPQKNTFKSYTSNGKPNQKLSDNIVFSIFEDSNNLIWIGTNQGLNVLNPQNDSIMFYGTDDGLPNEVIYGILADGDENLWLSTNMGISRFNPNTNTFTNYNILDGLQSNEFNGGAFHKGKSGTLYFGGVYGLNSINPDELREFEPFYQTTITNFEIPGNSLNIHKSPSSTFHNILQSDNSLFISKHISYTDSIVLDYNQRFFSIEFSGQNHLYPASTNYTYKLHPLDKDWHYAGKRNYISYANLKPGNYTFKVNSSSQEGFYKSIPAELKITIKPPFWMTDVFIAFEILMAILLIVFIYHYLLKTKLTKALQTQNTIISETNQLLKKSEQELKQINATKDRFFSIISHDLKNPLTSILSISESLYSNYDHSDEEDKRMGFSMINNSLKSLHSLLNNLLTWSRSQRGVINFEMNEFNLSSLIFENINLYKLPCEKKSISISTDINNDITAFANRDTINTIIRNLVNNAVKYTMVNGNIKISISNNNPIFWTIKIIDDGVGIDEENLEKLFKIDSKIKTPGTAGEKGTGLGLIICKEFAEKNKGSIGVKSKLNKGSEFWFTVRKHKP